MLLEFWKCLDPNIWDFLNEHWQLVVYFLDAQVLGHISWKSCRRPWHPNSFDSEPILTSTNGERRRCQLPWLIRPRPLSLRVPLQTHSVWWRPIKAGGGRGGTRQAFKIASMWERNHVLSLSGCKKRCWDPTLSSFQHEMPPFAEPTPGPAPHLWHKKVSNQFDFNVNQNHLSISISPNVSHIDQIPLISCTSH